MCEVKSVILLIISFLNPNTTPKVKIITETPIMTPIVPILTIGLLIALLCVLELVILSAISFSILK
jgi:hypothetical protein